MRRYYIILMALFCSAALLFVSAADSAKTSSDTSKTEAAVGAEPVMASYAEIESGVYTIKNKASGLCINAFDTTFSEGAYVYTDAANGKSGQAVFVEKQSDGSYLLYPQSENGEFAICAESGEPGARFVKSSDISSLSTFSFTGDENGYAIATFGGGVLGTTDAVKLQGKTLVMAEEYSGADSQMWTLEPINVTSLELKTVSERVRKNSVSAVYALVEPSYMKPFVEWSSSDEGLLLIDEDGSFCALGEGVVTVNAIVGELSQSIEVNIVDSDAFTWYSQHLVSDGGWRGDELKNVYFYSGVHERYIINGFNQNIDWMDQGCYITSVAMVLHNLGARYPDGYDFRFDVEGNLEIDPYVASLSNSRNHGIYTSSGTIYGNPISVNISAIASNVTLYGQPITITKVGGVSKKALKELLDKHPEGVIVGMKKGSDSHYIVVTECLNPYANPSEYRFQIFDSAGLRRNHADDVAFEKSMSYVTIGYRYSSMTSMTVIDIIPEE